MKALFTAIKAKFDAAPPTGLSGKLFLEEAPQGTVAPYVVYRLVSNVPEWTFKDRMERTRIQFSIYSGGRSAVEVSDAMAALQALFDECELTVTGYGHLAMQRDQSVLFREFDTWAYHVDYQVLIEKT